MAKPSPFGKESRVKILTEHFAATTVTTATAWQFVYRELLWIDGSTGLAHLYESDKAQPGRSKWFDRTILFTDLLCAGLGGITREELKAQIDRLFRACLETLIKSKSETSDAAELREAWTSDEPELTDARTESYVPDAELVVEFAQLLVQRTLMAEPEAESFARELVSKARYFFTVERKRQNVLGEGFEDLLQLLVLHLARVPSERVIIRKRADTLPGFHGSTTRDRIEAPDMAVVGNARTDLLASIKWSLRHDRQKQLSDELDCYVDLLSQRQFPRYILVTNEYDPGRLVNADGLARRGQKVDCIYHINLDLLLKVLADHPKAADLKPLIKSGRLRSVEDFLNDLQKEYGSSEKARKRG